jgi:hypothetical protein
VSHAVLAEVASRAARVAAIEHVRAGRLPAGDPSAPDIAQPALTDTVPTMPILTAAEIEETVAGFFDSVGSFSSEAAFDIDSPLTSHEGQRKVPP